MDFQAWPDAQGRFGDYGGSYVAETLMAPLAELREAYERLSADPGFLAELDRDLQHYVGRPSPIYHAEQLSRHVGGAASCSSARTSTTPVRTRSTTPSARRWWHGTWASNA